MDRKKDHKIIEPEMMGMIEKGGMNGAEKYALECGDKGISKAERAALKNGGMACRVSKDFGGPIKDFVAGKMNDVANNAMNVGRSGLNMVRKAMHLKEGGRAKKAAGGVGKIRHEQYYDAKSER